MQQFLNVALVSAPLFKGRETETRLDNMKIRSFIMNKSLAGVKVAVLVSNGFCEEDLTETQRLLIAEGADYKLVSLDHGLVNSWHEHGWGHHFTVDSPLSSALAADYSMLILPGGRRSIDKLKLTAHTRRFIGGFMAAGKPIAVCGRALQLMIFADQISGKTVTAPDDLCEASVRAGAKWTNNTHIIDGNLLTGKTEEHRETFIQKVLEHFTSHVDEMAEAA